MIQQENEVAASQSKVCLLLTTKAWWSQAGGRLADLGPHTQCRGWVATETEDDP
jgi:hypothetical protein